MEENTNTTNNEDVEIVNDPLTESNAEYVPEVTETPMLTMLGNGNTDPIAEMVTLTSTGNPTNVSEKESGSESQDVTPSSGQRN